jgi:hypothetical protein
MVDRGRGVSSKATGGGAGQFLTIPGGGAGRGRRQERHSEMGNPFGGSREEGSSPVRPSAVAWVSEGEQ